jgi:hypothetical protein
MTLLLLAACGGGGTGPTVQTPGSVAPPAVVPPVGQNFDTAEYRRSNAAVAAGAIAAWNAGASGQGTTIGFVDSGIDTMAPEFAGRIAPASRDVTGAGRPIADASGHGTAVAAIAAAARDGAQIVGIAPQATLAVMRADGSDSCQTSCQFSGAAIAAGVNAAVDSGARVINISLGGGADGAMQAAFARAGRSGVVLVIAAGNDGGATIDPLPAAALAVAGPTTIVVGSTDAAGALSSFSSRAGAAAPAYIAALGEAVRSFDQHNAPYLYSGTSAAAPAVSGAIALLAQAFPQMSAQQLVALLLATARDAGDPGTDAVYGRGLLDLAAAFAPGATAGTRGTGAAISTRWNGTLGPLFGDGLATNLGSVPITDRFGRSYVLDVGRTLAANAVGRLARQLDQGLTQHTRLSGGGPALAWGMELRGVGPIPPRPDAEPFQRLVAMPSVPQGFNPLRQTRLRLQSGAFELEAATGWSEPALPRTADAPLIAPDAFDRPADAVGGTARQFRAAVGSGALRFVVSADSRQQRGVEGIADGMLQRAPYREQRWTAGLDLRQAPVALRAQGSIARAEGGFLGTQLSPALGLRGGTTAEAGLALAAHWPVLDLELGGRLGWHRPAFAGGILDQAEPWRSAAWSVRAIVPSGRADRLSLAVVGPEALTAGAIAIHTGAAVRTVLIAPPARERAIELDYRSGGLALSLFQRFNAGHLAGITDHGAAIRWSSDL